MLKTKLIVSWTLPPTITTITLLMLAINPTPAQSYFRLSVNSNLDGEITPDGNLTLREAIEIVNGNLPVSQLSLAEKAQIVPQTDNEKTANLITFNLPENATTIKLIKELPAIQAPAIIDGTTQPGYIENSSNSPIAVSQICQNQQTNFNAKIPQPLVTLTPAADVEVLRGLTIVSGDVTVRGLNFYGFNSRYQNRETAIASVLPASILISDKLPAESLNQISNETFKQPLQIPRNVVIEKNQFGAGASSSAFGILIFKSQGTIIQQNQIVNHTGSGIITGSIAENTQIIGNIIANNGYSGMANGLHFEGKITNSEISENMICQNAGSAIFFFKTQGATKIIKNDLVMNGRERKTAAIYLMGEGHQVIENQISEQNGPGVAVAAYPHSYRNKITANSFSTLDGLSIDLTNQLNESSLAYLIGDGPNTLRNSYYRREETGNKAINPPQFLAKEFLILGDKVNIDGKADVGTIIEIYRVKTQPKNSANLPYGPLSELIATVQTDKEGRFGISLKTLKTGDVISAIATDPEFGTSEPALNAAIIKQ
ncbi:right-handed parallel beta-helix repeat-containing protein [Ancylothrix sp. C2]|uniref:right-handed parallel beta-helix repeat-containing protein n=1 Tax=Ancylothrix sp. D3o TaxID=2953691 RepID=UPI0021BB37AF|nr:right-handed parallel beta-helix repeat-containing protein [Ancylothrix sp. D3o]MCT7951393.1 right-handed parallel beta-helix repeat-containing protein [Ancylothrix sp. D3o]